MYKEKWNFKKYLVNITVINCFRQESSMYAKGVEVEEYYIVSTFP